MRDLLTSIDTSQRLYVLKCGDGYSCLGFDVAFDRATRIAEWLNDPTLVPLSADKGTAKGYRSYVDTTEAARVHFEKTGQRCSVELTAQLNGHENKRVEVIDCYGAKRRFWVGKSTGWIPVHLEISTRRSHGGPAVMGTPFQSVRVIAPSRI